MAAIDEFVNRIICGDCLAVMKQLPDKCVDFAFADPPYGIGKAEWDDKYFEGFEQELLRLSRKGVAITPGQENIGTCITALGANYKGILAARNKNGMTFNKIGFGNWIPVVVGGSIKRGQDFMEFVIKEDKPPHPSPKPVQFMKLIIQRFTEPGDVVLDPFLGSGTTAFACHYLNRNFIGIEINPDYCKIAEDRLRQGVLF